jgi:CHAT domain-containing protein
MKQLGQRLNEALIKPLPVERTEKRLVIVPYGLLHYLPFNLLYTGDHYLIEDCEIVLVPTSGLLTREAPLRPAGALVLAHSNEGRLPSILTEAGVVHELLTGRLYQEQATSRKLLAQEPVQILHIAAHGKHRIDQPDLSFVQLGDGQLYTDDLLQHDLSYELVTLSACETGRAVVKPGEELIGLGRGVLCAGAGALLASLWRVEDVHTAEFMQSFYRLLKSGESKAAALRGAQRQILECTPDLHPAFWGAFQLIGDAGPLSA